MLAEQVETCCICLEVPRHVGELECGYKFCVGCIRQWKDTDSDTLNCARCPLCKSDFSKI
ncbi:hypothetical protein JKP88DRAFT_166702, partial [Tribonema minus]